MSLNDIVYKNFTEIIIPDKHIPRTNNYCELQKCSSKQITKYTSYFALEVLLLLLTCDCLRVTDIYGSYMSVLVQHII